MKIISPGLVAFFSSVVWLLLISSCATQHGRQAEIEVSAPVPAQPAPRFAVSAASPEAQAAFDHALILSFAFNHGLAEKTFREAAEMDPKLAMAWWGVALVNGPHINFPMVPEDRATVAWEALSKAQELAAGANAREQALIAALAHRYAAQQPADRRPLDEAYAAAMREVQHQYPDDATITTLAAESLMDLRPWDLWKDDGTPQPGTEEILSLLEHALSLDPRHPGATHLYIHATEASPNAARAELAADSLRAVAPELGLGVGHLIHMPSHIYARVGRWKDAAEANQSAMEADALYRAENPKPGFFALYMLHNRHFFGWAAMMQGRSEDAIRTAREMAQSIPPDFLEQYAPVADGFLAYPYEALMRFGKWQELLDEPAPPANLPLAQALWHYARAVALTALGKLTEAGQERAVFLAAAEAVPEAATFGNNRSHDLLAIAAGVLDGEMAAKKDDFRTAVLRLEEAVRREDKLRYDEPPDWIQPARHTLGAVLLRAGRHAAAEQVYREDLQRLPENPWALFGLLKALQLQNKTLEAQAVELRFNRAWEKADIEMLSSCYCQLL